VEAINPGCIDFVNPEDYGSIMVEECRITTHRCLLEKLEVYGSI
jgi:hypothetical protein